MQNIITYLNPLTSLVQIDTAGNPMECPIGLYCRIKHFFGAISANG